MQNRKLLFGVAIVLILALVATAGSIYMSSTPAPRNTKRVQPAQVPPAQASQPKEQGTEQASAGIPVEPITEFRPGTVYSGTLGEVTGIQAGRDINKAAYEYKQYQVKLKELDDKLAEKPAIVPSLSLPPVTQGIAKGSTPESKPSRLVVLSVKGASTLTATLRSSAGTYTVKVGDTVPGFGTVSSISRDKVIVNNSSLPWL